MQELKLVRLKFSDGPAMISRENVAEKAYDSQSFNSFYYQEQVTRKARIYISVLSVI
jgi:hypothetical protein